MNINKLQNQSKISLKKIYGSDKKVFEYHKNRYHKLYKLFKEKFGEQPVKYFSSPGRIEISGNHTDHNNGNVIAASINLDSIACVAKGDQLIEIYSEGYDRPFIVNPDNLNQFDQEAGTTNALIRGITSGFVKNGLNIGGFKAFISSKVVPGSGLSSSASIEVLIGTVFNYFFNEGKVSPIDIAKIGQYAENKFFKKPCGLMDQIACASGGIVAIDFKDENNPLVNKINFDFSKHGYSIIIINTGSSHARLTDDYSAIPIEMKDVASILGKDVCREINLKDVLNKIRKIRGKVSDRAILRAYHFFKENERVKRQIKGLKQNDINKFLKLVNDSGNSSFKWLQNIYSPKDVDYQPVSLALALTEEFIIQKGEGACRVHGGGFAGSIQVFLPNNFVKEYKSFMSKIFGENSFKIILIRETGAVCFNL